MFTKIRQTIESLRTKPLELTMNEMLIQYGKEVQARASGVKRQQAVRMGVYIAILIPSSILLSDILHKLAPNHLQAVGAAGILIGYFVGLAFQKAHDELIKRVPFYKLNPYFGSKLDQTIAALKKAQ